MTQFFTDFAPQFERERIARRRGFTDEARVKLCRRYGLQHAFPSETRHASPRELRDPTAGAEALERAFLIITKRAVRREA